jgi:hypothetical protein
MGKSSGLKDRRRRGAAVYNGCNAECRDPIGGFLMDIDIVKRNMVAALIAAALILS